MNILNDLLKLRKQYPNNNDFAENVSTYISARKTCCDNPENIISFEDLDSSPYGWDVIGTKCKACGTIINCKIVN